MQASAATAKPHFWNCGLMTIPAMPQKAEQVPSLEDGQAWKHFLVICGPVFAFEPCPCNMQLLTQSVTPRCSTPQLANTLCGTESKRDKAVQLWRPKDRLFNVKSGARSLSAVSELLLQ